MMEPDSTMFQCYNSTIMPTFSISNPADLTAVATRILQLVSAEDRAAVVALHGELGAGKTTLVQHIAKALGVKEDVTSPTFVIQKEYETETNLYQVDMFVHIDAYRIEDPREMEVLRLSEMIQSPRTLVCIEWAENISELLPDNIIDVTLTMSDQDGGRKVVIHGS